MARIAPGERRQVVLVGVVQRLVAHDAFLLHLQVAIQRGLVHGQIGGRRVHLVLLDIGLVGGHIGLGGGQLRALRIHLRQNLHLVELRQLLALLHPVVDVHVELFHDARGLAFDLDLGDGLNLAGGHHRPRHVAARNLGQLVGIDGGALGQPHQRKAQQQHHHGCPAAQPDPETFALSRCSHKSSPEVKKAAAFSEPN